MCCSSKSNAANSPLLRLPAEIRNLIFAYVFDVTGYELELADHHYARRAVLSGSGAYLRTYVLRLLLVCRQVHAETALLAYELGSFIFRANEWDPHEAVVAMRSFLERRSPIQLRAIGKVTLWRYPAHHRCRFWAQTRTAAYWLAKLDGMVFASDANAEMYFGVPKRLDIADLGPTDFEST